MLEIYKTFKCIQTLLFDLVIIFPRPNRVNFHDGKRAERSVVAE